ncbi:hypothetical protein V2P57_01835 [Mycoplasma mycoides subsp. mycoides]|uniref:hypothetical protein n=2 Tax=Mycoplasma mycoides TaxID=2102 RepID=UPI0005413354|nr:hypothetical protein [Mycoplasma mycoides]AIZ55219.1 hypothetical protein mycmycITA_00392 [Mycoplasma mycoides subsp. mycoides]
MFSRLSGKRRKKTSEMDVQIYLDNLNITDKFKITNNNVTNVSYENKSNKLNQVLIQLNYKYKSKSDLIN